MAQKAGARSYAQPGRKQPGASLPNELWDTVFADPRAAELVRRSSGTKNEPAQSTGSIVFS